MLWRHLPNLSPCTLVLSHRPHRCDNQFKLIQKCWSLSRLFNHHLCRLIAGNANTLMVRGWLRPSELDGHSHDLKLATKLPVPPQSLVSAHCPMHMNLLQLIRNLLPIIVPLQNLVKYPNQSKLRQMFGILWDHWKQVSDCLNTRYFKCLEQQYASLGSKISVPYDVPGSTRHPPCSSFVCCL